MLHATGEDIDENLRLPDTSIDDYECKAPPSLLADAPSALPVGRPRLNFAHRSAPQVRLSFWKPHPRALPGAAFSSTPLASRSTGFRLTSTSRHFDECFELLEQCPTGDLIERIALFAQLLFEIRD
jgi:hypothetical protein